jgi:hypothetical protein
MRNKSNPSVATIVGGVLARQAATLAGQTGKPVGEAMGAVLEIKAGRLLAQQRTGPHRDEPANRWQEDCAPRRAKERVRARQKERNQAAQDASWERFMQGEMRELELGKDGQHARVLSSMRGAITFRGCF